LGQKNVLSSRQSSSIIPSYNTYFLRLTFSHGLLVILAISGRSMLMMTTSHSHCLLRPIHLCRLRLLAPGPGPAPVPALAPLRPGNILSTENLNAWQNSKKKNRYLLRPKQTARMILHHGFLQRVGKNYLKEKI
jgi:hypothetical protein